MEESTFEETCLAGEESSDEEPGRLEATKLMLCNHCDQLAMVSRSTFYCHQSERHIAAVDSDFTLQQHYCFTHLKKIVWFSLISLPFSHQNDIIYELYFIDSFLQLRNLVQFKGTVRWYWSRSITHYFTASEIITKWTFTITYGLACNNGKRVVWLRVMDCRRVGWPRKHTGG